MYGVTATRGCLRENRAAVEGEFVGLPRGCKPGDLAGWKKISDIKTYFTVVRLLLQRSDKQNSL